MRRITRDIHRRTIIDNRTYIRTRVFYRRGWHHHHHYSYYHHPSHYGLIAVYYGDVWFWVHYRNGHWYWHHPHHHRWLGWHNDHWWYHHPTRGWIIWHDDSDRFYVVHPDRIVRELPQTTPEAPPAEDEEEEEKEETVYYSEDGTLVVYVLGEKKMAHLYTFPELEHVAYLGDGVKSVRFTEDRYNDDAMIIVAEFEDGQIGLFDQHGQLYGPPVYEEEEPEGDEPPTSVERMEGVLEDLPGGIDAPGELPDAPAFPEGAPVM